MMRRSEGTMNLNEVTNRGARPRRHTGGIRRLSRNFGVFDQALVQQAARDPERLERIAKATEQTSNSATSHTKATPAA